MPREWSVTTERLKQSANVIEEKKGKYDTEWQKLYTEVQNLKSSQWQGIASDTFNQKLESYRDEFEELSKVLQSYHDFLETSAEQYEKTEEAVKDAANSL
ncbi:MAG: WXG100 family type VII secretion target [Lachnospiraceae bacterium]|nr:WXG100 family type VII secretion target [Lachnospiraceae bacterium]